MKLKNPPVARAQMLIRKPVAVVFDAFVNPQVTTNFWFTKSSGHMLPGTSVRWDWEMYGVSAQVNVKTVEQNQRILIEWDEPPFPVEWVFSARGEDATLVSITSQGFHGNDDEVVAKALDMMGGFSTVLAGAKAWLEHGIALNLVADHNPPDDTK